MPVADMATPASPAIGNRAGATARLAIMVTDTAFNRYPHYHLPTDTPEKLDYARMAKVTMGLAAVIRELAK